MSNGHAPFPPSAAKRWMTCTGSFALCLQAPPEVESVYAAEGTRLHEVAAGALHAIGLPQPTQDDYAALKPYLDYARKRMRAADVVYVEQRIEHSQLLGGTPDLLMHFFRNDLLEVVDLKNGAGIMVDPTENHQMLTYAYLALCRMGDEAAPKNIRLTVVQPPDEAKPVKSWDTTIERVLEHGAAVEAAIQTAITGQGELVPGDHCRFCRAKSICPKLRGEVVEALGDALPSTMTTASLAQWLDRADRMEAFIADVRKVGHDVASAAVLQGVSGIPGWGLKAKRATRSWADEELVLKIARRRKIKIYQDRLLSPAMAEKEHPNMPEELTKQIVSVSSGMNLVRMDTQPPTVKMPEDATKLERLKANIVLMNYRR